jgi:thiamine biosynthesis lipoprotein
VRLGPGPGAPTAELAHCALAVSAPHGRTLEVDGRAHGHVLDPRTGASVDGARLAAVIARDATRADAWSTALLVAGARLRHVPYIETLLHADGDWRHRPGPGTPRFTRIPLRETV